MGPCVRGCGAPKASEEASVAWHCTHWIPTAPTPDGDDVKCDGMEALQCTGRRVPRDGFKEKTRRRKKERAERKTLKDRMEYTTVTPNNVCLRGAF